jgi:hypothetical protein
VDRRASWLADQALLLSSGRPVREDLSLAREFKALLLLRSGPPFRGLDDTHSSSTAARRGIAHAVHTYSRLRLDRVGAKNCSAAASRAAVSARDV